MTDFNLAISSLISHFTWPLLFVSVLLLISEALGSIPSIKASSIYEVFKSLIITLKDQVWPKSN